MCVNEDNLQITTPLPSPQNKNTNMRLERYKGKQQFTCMYIGPLKCEKKDNLNTVEVK